jgi:hypothetical protein
MTTSVRAGDLDEPLGRSFFTRKGRDAEAAVGVLNGQALYFFGAR